MTTSPETAEYDAAYEMSVNAVDGLPDGMEALGDGPARGGGEGRPEAAWHPRRSQEGRPGEEAGGEGPGEEGPGEGRQEARADRLDWRAEEGAAAAPD